MSAFISGPRNGGPRRSALLCTGLHQGSALVLWRARQYIVRLCRTQGQLRHGGCTTSHTLYVNKPVPCIPSRFYLQKTGSGPDMAPGVVEHCPRVQTILSVRVRTISVCSLLCHSPQLSTWLSQCILTCSMLFYSEQLEEEENAHFLKPMSIFWHIFITCGSAHVPPFSSRCTLIGLCQLIFHVNLLRLCRPTVCSNTRLLSGQMYLIFLDAININNFLT